MQLDFTRTLQSLVGCLGLQAEACIHIMYIILVSMLLNLRAKNPKTIVSDMLTFIKEHEPAGFAVLKANLKELKQRMLRRS